MDFKYLYNLLDSSEKYNMLAENFIFVDFFAGKVDASADVKEGIFKEVFMFSCSQILTLTSINQL